MKDSTVLVETECQILVSRHALRRARQRMHWDSSATTRMATRAFLGGLTQDNTTGTIRFNLLRITNPVFSACAYLYGENIFVFAQNPVGQEVVLLTVYRANREVLQSRAKRARLHWRSMGFQGIRDGTGQLRPYALVELNDETAASETDVEVRYA